MLPLSKCTFLLLKCCYSLFSLAEASREYCNGDFCVTLKEAAITAEAGLCVIIPCSFKQTYFRQVQMVWLKCEWRRNTCPSEGTIFHSDKWNTEVQDSYRGRVSLLEPDTTRQNCGIIINDLAESDSGSYQFRLVGINYYDRWDRYSFSRRVTLRVTGKQVLKCLLSKKDLRGSLY